MSDPNRIQWVNDDLSASPWPDVLPDPEPEAEVIDIDRTIHLLMPLKDPLSSVIEAIAREKRAAEQLLWPERFGETLRGVSAHPAIQPGDIVLNEHTGVRYEYREPDEWRPLTIWRWRQKRAGYVVRRKRRQVRELVELARNLRVVDRRDQDRGEW